ncbi:MAG: hypothetical protein ACLR23_21580 [Clostridia bacterium]
MHAGEMKKGRGQRAHRGKIPAVTVETAKLAEKQNKNARRRDEERRRPACTQRQNPCRHSRNSQTGGETE